jgi:tetratricopeptide (TPR) repeat protein
MCKFISPFLLCLGLIFSGCSGIASSINYTKGTEYLDKRDYRKAIQYLEKAVELDPDFGRNHINLCAAYASVGNWEKAWFHSRQAVLCPMQDPEDSPFFWSIYEEYVRRRGLDKEGISLQDIIGNLGQPDLLTWRDDTTVCTYGLCVMEFDKGKLIKCNDSMAPRCLLQKK